MCAAGLRDVLRDDNTDDNEICQAVQRLDSAVRTLSGVAAPEALLWNVAAAVLGR